MLKKSWNMKNPYLSRNVQPHSIMVSLHELCNNFLYRYEGIIIYDKWEEIFNWEFERNNNALLNIA